MPRAPNVLDKSLPVEPNPQVETEQVLPRLPVEPNPQVETEQVLPPSRVRSIWDKYGLWILIAGIIIIIIGIIVWVNYDNTPEEKYALSITKSNDVDYIITKGNDKSRDGHFIDGDKDPIIKIIDSKDSDVYLEFKFDADGGSREDSEMKGTMTFKQYEFIMESSGKRITADVDYKYYDDGIIAILDNLSIDMDKFNIKIDSELLREHMGEDRYNKLIYNSDDSSFSFMMLMSSLADV